MDFPGAATLELVITARQIASTRTFRYPSPEGKSRQGQFISRGVKLVPRMSCESCVVTFSQGYWVVLWLHLNFHFLANPRGNSLSYYLSNFRSDVSILIMAALRSPTESTGKIRWDSPI